MQPLKITAHLGSAIATYDSWSPSLDSLLEWLLLDELNLISPNPTPEQVQATRGTVDDRMPLSKGEIMGEWYWKVSSPCYQIVSEYTDKFRKRWDNHDQNLNWSKRKAKWSTSEVPEKSYDLPLYCRNVENITWYAVGNREAIAFHRGSRLLQLISHVAIKNDWTSKPSQSTLP
ncbi:hypothetical protein [Nostoc sp.]|uniref:hypothetical protein n=1 Tax=Nostoc sp. TaxID=1180 RepID=UPI002FF9D130